MRVDARFAKLGWTWILDRETGKPLEPVKQVKVPVSKAPEVNSWPTQPIPQGPNVIDDPKDDERERQAVRERPPDARRTPTSRSRRPPRRTASRTRSGCQFDPYDTTQYVAFPFEEMDWPASSYSPPRTRSSPAA